MAFAVQSLGEARTAKLMIPAAVKLWNRKRKRHNRHAFLLRIPLQNPPQKLLEFRGLRTLKKLSA